MQEQESGVLHYVGSNVGKDGIPHHFDQTFLKTASNTYLSEFHKNLSVSVTPQGGILPPPTKCASVKIEGKTAIITPLVGQEQTIDLEIYEMQLKYWSSGSGNRVSGIVHFRRNT